MDTTEYNKMINDARIRAILKAQEQIESSGGKNIDHATMNSGLHAGTSAKGRYGIMPATMKDLAKNMSKDKEAQEAVSIQDEEQLKDYFKSHPELEDRLALEFIKKANDKMGGDYDPEKITYAWQWGQNKTPEQFEADKKNNPEVRERLAKLKKYFKDPYPYQGPSQLPESDTERALAKASPQNEPSPVPNEPISVNPTPIESPKEIEQESPAPLAQNTEKFNEAPIIENRQQARQGWGEYKDLFPKLKQMYLGKKG